MCNAPGQTSKRKPLFYFSLPILTFAPQHHPPLPLKPANARASWHQVFTKRIISAKIHRQDVGGCGRATAISCRMNWRQTHTNVFHSIVLPPAPNFCSKL